MSAPLKGCSEKSLEFLIARSTDPFLSDAEREEFLQQLLTKIEENLEAPQHIFKLISHKLLSPDQGEVLNTLKVLDKIVRYGGNRIAKEIAKFKFLNNFIRILSPKHQGLQTSAEVRQKSIELLYYWKETLRHLEKIREVYELLKRQNVIDVDPQITIEIPTTSSWETVPRMASFENEEKAEILARLLKSKRIGDLQAANRMIKNMVRAEDKKIENFHKRKEVLAAAGNKVDLLWSMLQEQANEAAIFDNDERLNFSKVSKMEYTVMKAHYDAVVAFRPILFRLASEATDDNDEEDSLTQILTLNDRANHLIELFKERFADQLTNTNRQTQNEPIDNIINLMQVDEGNDKQSDFYNEHFHDDDDTGDDVAILCSPAPIRRKIITTNETYKCNLICSNPLDLLTNSELSPFGTGLAESTGLNKAIINLDLSLRRLSNVPLKDARQQQQQEQDQFLLDDIVACVSDLDIDFIFYL